MTAPFAVQGIDHVVLRAMNVASLTAFYEDVLGCRVERVAGNLTQMRAGASLIDIVPGCGSTIRDAGRNVDHICLTLTPSDEDKISSWLESQGICVGEIATRYGADGYGRSIYLTDPEGNGLELREAVR